MKIEMVQGRGYAVIEREANDPKIYSESRLWYMIRKKLLETGRNVIKKLMWKDGHMVSDHQHYVRSRDIYKSDDPSFFMLHDGNYMLRCMYEDWNKGKLTLECHWNKGN
jgi:hypothetical protein